MIKVRLFTLLRQLVFLTNYQSEKTLTDFVSFKLAVATDCQEVGEEFAKLLSINSHKEVPVFSLDFSAKDYDFIIFLLLDWSKESLLKVQESVKAQTNYLLISLADSYLSLVFRKGREAGIPSHRLFVWMQEDDYDDFFKGALKLVGKRKFALAKNYPVFLPFLKELLITNAAFNLGWNAFRGSPSFLFFFFKNFKNFKQLSNFSDSETSSRKLVSFLALISLPTSLVQIASSRLISSQNRKLIRALSTGLSTFLIYRLVILNFFKKKT